MPLKAWRAVVEFEQSAFRAPDPISASRELSNEEFFVPPELDIYLVTPELASDRFSEA
jgi:hypothetical protein